LPHRERTTRKIDDRGLPVDPQHVPDMVTLLIPYAVRPCSAPYANGLDHALSIPADGAQSQRSCFTARYRSAATRYRPPSRACPDSAAERRTFQARHPTNEP
jgi:hypothetical protein